MENNNTLAGKTCLVTGASSGHGKAVAVAIARMGADMILLCRNGLKCAAVQDEIEIACGKRPRAVLCDLSSRDDISRAAAEIISLNIPIDILVNNAGQVNQKRTQTRDGIEATFAVNYLALFQLTLLLLPAIRGSGSARIVNISSDSHRIASIDLDDFDGSKRKYSLMNSYGRSKLGILYFTRELAKRLEGQGITVNAVDPGPVASNIANQSGLLAKLAHAIISLTFPNPEKAARTAVYAATSKELEGMTGKYLRFMKINEPKVSPDPGFGRRVWELSAAITGVDIS